MNKIKTLGIIMDGNRRFAKTAGLSPLSGHEFGAEKLREVLRWSRELGIETVIVYAFSTENWRRSKPEVDFLLNLFQIFLTKELDNFIADKVSFHCIGDRGSLPEGLQTSISNLERQTIDGTQKLVLAVSYGGRAEILGAVKRLLSEPDLAGKILDEASFSNYLQTAGFPDPDLILRTGGEFRLSNFLPWQAVYSELYFTPTYWPALTKEEFLRIIQEVEKRDRRFGS